MRYDDVIRIPSIEETDAIIRARGQRTLVHPAGIPNVEIPIASTTTRYDEVTGTITIQCFRNPSPTESALKYSLAAARKQGVVHRLTLIVMQSILQDDLDLQSWLADKKFSRDIGAEVFGGQLAYTKMLKVKDVEEK
jgi:hypothetical protein